MKAFACSLAQCVADADGQVIDADQAFLALLDRERREVVGRSLLDFTHQDDRALAAEQLERLAAIRVPFAIVQRYLRRDGVPQWVSNRVALIHEGAGPARVLVTGMAAGWPSNTVLSSNLAAVRDLCALMTSGRRLLGVDLVSAPFPELLVRLYAAELEGWVATLETLAGQLELPARVVSRYLRHLVTRGLVEVERGDADSKEAVFRIARCGEAAVGHLLESVRA